MQVDKKNGNICFNDASHIYFEQDNPECRYTSVTTLIHGFQQPFDAEFKSAVKALESFLPKEVYKEEKKSLRSKKVFDRSILSAYNISETEFNKVQQEILDAWERNKNEACERGTAIHLELENSFYKKKTDIDVSRFGVGGKFTCKKDYTELDLPYGIYPEYLIYKKSKDGLLRIAGQIDLLIKDGNEITIVDHKGLPLDTPILTNQGFKTMGQLEIGDILFDKDGNQTCVLEKSEIHNNPCYEISFNTGESIIADHEHKWVVDVGESKLVTTVQMSELLQEGYTVAIECCKPIQSSYKQLPIDPFVLGYCLSRSTKDFSKFINDRGYSFPISLSDLDITESLPTEYLLSSIDQRKSLFYGLLSNASISNNVALCQLDLVQLPIYEQVCASLGIPYYVLKSDSYVIFYVELDALENGVRKVTKVVQVETVPTQCIVVDSPSHTYLAGYSMIPTHNSNKEIRKKGFYDSGIKSEQKMLYPLNNLPDANFYHYTMQLSTYAWMLQQINPNFVIKDLILNHYDHNGNNTLYHCDYLKTEVERMLAYHKKQILKQIHQERLKPINYD